MKKKLNNLIKTKFIFDNRFVFIFFVVLVFVLYKQLFSSYFEADEWPAFTLNLPLIHDPLGFLKIMIKNGDDSATIAQSQHIVPIGREIFFLNVLLFGTNFFPYAFISLFLHALNSFLVFLVIRMLLPRKTIFAFLGGLFFVLAPTPMHAVTWAAIYPTSVLPVTLSLLSIIFFKLAFLKENKKFIYFSLTILFISLLTKETSFILFIILPMMALFEKRIFSLKFLGKIFTFCLVAYILIRFIVPNASMFKDRLVDQLVDRLTRGQISASMTQETKIVDTGTIVSHDLSIYKNLPAEVISRTVTFPLRMVGTVFVPRSTVFSIVQFITPIMIPTSAIGDSSSQLAFLYGPGNFVIIYLVSFAIVIFCLRSILSFIRQSRIQEAQTLATGLAVILLSALPLVPIIFTFPRWGFDFYFDSRYYYPANIGAAIVFPFLLFGIAKFFSKSFNIKSISIVTSIIFLIWLVNNMYIFNLTLNQFANRFGSDRREVLDQVKHYLPVLPKKIVFYFETDGKSAFGPALPFYTSVPQALTVVYYDKSPLPNSFFAKPLFNGMPQGYSYFESRGFGYYTSKKDLSQALLEKKFDLSDIHAFYYKSLEGKLLDKTSQVRREMRDYLNNTDIRDWRRFNDPSLGIKFLYPQLTEIENLKPSATNIVKSLLLKDPQFTVQMFFINVSPSFNISDNIQFQGTNGMPSTFQDIIEKDVFFDKYHFNKLTVTNEDNPRYFLRFGNILVYVKTVNNNTEGLKILERILGSLEIINEN